MNKTFIGVGIVIIIVLGFLALRQDSPTIQNEKVVVGGSIFPIVDIARVIAGDTADVVQILPSGASPHTFQLTPQKVRELQNAEIIFKIGIIDDWVDSVIESVPRADVVVVGRHVSLREFDSSEHDHEDEAHDEEHEGEMHDEDHEDEMHNEEEMHPDEEGEHHHEGVDPHYWLDVSNAKIIAENIYESLVMINPESEEYYSQNLADYLSELDETDEMIAKQLEVFEGAEVIMFHNGWNYFAARYGLDIVGVFEMSPGQEPLPGEIKEIYDVVTEHGVKTLFTEPQLATSAYIPFVEDLGLEVYVLDPLGGVSGRGSYIEMMEYNAHTVAEALASAQKK